MPMDSRVLRTNLWFREVRNADDDARQRSRQLRAGLNHAQISGEFWGSRTNVAKCAKQGVLLTGEASLPKTERGR